jgi:hypothetical protein
LADSWFSSSENMKYIHATLEKQFIFALKSNRLIALNKEDKGMLSNYSLKLIFKKESDAFLMMVSIFISYHITFF